jgi:hypothetical protein
VGWTGKGTHEDPNRPDWKTHKVDKYEDVTGQPGTKIPTEPNFFVARIETDNSTLEAMKSDGYIILWAQPVPAKGEIGQAPKPVEPLPKQTKVELDKLKYDLEYIGVPTSATALADTSKADVTAVDISNQLRSVMKEFPKSTSAEDVKPK